jgi:predicted RNA-binding Zn ribbon-like protein
VAPGLGLELPLHAISRAAGDLLETTRPGEIRCCANPGCGWLFVDRAGRRRWCSMATCGNRQKARRHAARARAATAGRRHGS